MSEGKENAAKMQSDRQKFSMSLVHYLNKIEPTCHSHVISDLLVIFHAVDVMLFADRVSSWLRFKFSRDEAMKISKAALYGWSALPLKFEVMKTFGWTVTCRSGTSKQSLGEKGSGGRNLASDSGHNEDEDSEEEEQENYIEEISACTTDQRVNGVILACIHEGDLVCLNSHSSIWWTVYEMRPSQGKIFLSYERLKPGILKEPSSVQQSTDEALSEPVGTVDPPLHRVVKEFKEVRLEALMGALVKRAGFLTAKTYESLERDSECDFSASLLSFDQYEEYRLNKPVPRRSASSKSYEDQSVVVLFKMPSPSMDACLKRIIALARDFPRRDCSDDGPQGQGQGPATDKLDSIWHMQHQAQVKEHVSRWEQQRCAREILMKIDPYICMHRKEWLLICHLLRCISRGTDTLLQDFVNWTKAAGKDGEKRAKDCRSAWASARVRTICDTEALTAARGYLKSKGAGHKRIYFDSNGKLRPEATDVDPLARSVLDAAAIHTEGRNLSFSKQRLGDYYERADSDGTVRPETLLVPTAIYFHGALQNTDTPEKLEMPLKDFEANSHKIGSLLETKMLPCAIEVNDVLSIREPVGDISVAYQDGNPQRWVQVLAVDVLFARLQVVSCSGPPPHCWLPSHQEKTLAHPKFWIPVSKLWDVSVTRLLPPSADDITEEGQCKYQVFVTPVPSAEEALALLGELSKTYPLGDLGPKDRNQIKFKVYQPSEKVANDTKQMKKTAAILVNKENRRDLVGYLSIFPLRFYTDAVIVSWKVNASEKMSSAQIMDENPPIYSLFISDTHNPRVWAKIYQGPGTACQISGLASASEYRCRLVADNYPQFNRAYNVFSTLAAPPVVPPFVKRWELANVKGSIRGEVFIEDDTLYLPPGCQVQIEGSIGIAGSGLDEDDAEREWVPLARTSKRSTWIVGPFKGKTLLLRARCINKQAQPGPASGASLHEVPNLD